MVNTRIQIYLEIPAAVGITFPTAYRLARESGDFGRLERETINRLCEYFQVQPGDLIEWIPDRSSPLESQAAP